MSPGRPDLVWREEEPLAPHLPRRTGGTCSAWVVPHTIEAWADAEARLKDLGLSRTVVGTGSRLLVRDGGLAGAVIRLGRGFASVQVEDDGVTAGAAVPLAQIGAMAGSGPLSALRRQPGSLGGSLVSDAGWPAWLVSVDIWRRGGVRTIAPDELSSLGDRALVVGARLRWKPSGRARVPGVERPWSVFSEVPRADLAKVLRKGGLAGTRLRDVVLPASEPASVANLSSATARDIELLLKSVGERMKREQGVDLTVCLKTLGRVS